MTRRTLQSLLLCYIVRWTAYLSVGQIPASGIRSRRKFYQAGLAIKSTRDRLHGENTQNLADECHPVVYIECHFGRIAEWRG